VKHRIRIFDGTLFNLFLQTPCRNHSTLFSSSNEACKGSVIRAQRPQAPSFELFVCLLHCTATPSIASKCSHDPVLRPETPQMGQKFRHSGIHDIIEGGGSHETPPGFPELFNGNTHGRGSQLDYLAFNPFVFIPCTMGKAIFSVLCHMVS